ncbi:MAG: DUF6531 domain-containing protein, partial [Anaerolineae bacterium]
MPGESARALPAFPAPPPPGSLASHRLFLPLVARNYEPGLISPRGGTYTSPDGRVTVVFPPGAVGQAVRVHYREARHPMPEGFVALGFFSLEAEEAASGRPVTTFGAPLEIQVRYSDAGLPFGLENRLHLYYRAGNGRWERLPSAVDPERNEVVAWTTHMSDFGLLANTGDNPCDQAVNLAPAIPSGTAPSLPYTFFSGVTHFDYYSGTLIYLSSNAAGTGALFTRDHARITASGPGGGTWEHAFDGSSIPPQEVSRDLFPNAPFSATYSIQTLLWTEAYTTYASSAYYLTMKDVTPPEIWDATIWPDGEGGYYLEVTAVDNCAVASVDLVASSSSGGGASAGMGRVGPDRYGAAVRLPRIGYNTFIIIATDVAGNSSIWTARLPSTYSGGFGFTCLKGPCGGHQGTEGDPINTASGNFVTRTMDLRLPGIGNTEIRLERTYNAQAVIPGENLTVVGMRPGPFGPGWSWPFDFRVEFVDNVLLRGVKVHYPDGHTALFERKPDGAFTSRSPGNTDILQAVPGGYVLKQKDLTEYRFDAVGRLVEVRDPNGNTQTLTYDGAGRLVRVENSARRWIEIAYTPEGLIREITAPEGIRLQYAYTNGLLTAFTDARGQTWRYTYNAFGWLTAILSPKGHPILRLRYGESREDPTFGRVVEQIEGATARRTFAYDDFARRRTITDAYGRTTVHQYDDAYRLIRITDPMGYREEYGYDDQDRRISFQDKEGRQWRYFYDDRGNLIREEGPLGWVREWEYNDLNRLTLERDPAGRETRYGYDDRGNLTVITSALGFTRTFAYDPRGLPIRITDFNGNGITHTYDAAGNLIAAENGVGAVTRYAYDGLGRTTGVTTPQGAVFTYTYDGGSALLTGIFGPLGYRETYEYDPNGNLVRRVDPNGHETRYEYDSADRLVAEVNALGFTTVYTYGRMNETVAIQDAEGRVTTYEYDPLLRLTAVHAPEGATTRYEYDGVGNLVAETDPEGRVTRYIYNALDRLEQRIQNFIPGGPQNADVNVTTRYEYDPAGNLTKVIDPNGTATCYEYDALNRLTAEIRNCRPGEPPGPDVNVTTRYEYDPHGNLIRRINPRGFATRYAYDAANRLIAVTDALSRTTAYAYDLDNHLIAVMDAAGKVTRYEYDLLGRRTAEIRNFREGEPPSSDVNVTTRYAYDPAGNLVKVTDPNGIATGYEYDALNRLTAEIRNCRPGEPPGPDVNVVTRYEYDRVGNLVKRTDPNGHATRLVYDGLNRLVAGTDPEGHTITFAYDRVGNLLRRVDARGYATTWAYDALNRPITITDALSGTTVFRYDPAGNLLAQTDPNGHTTAYAYDGLYRLVTITDPEGYVTRYEYDPGGNRVAVVDANGNRTTFTYDPLDRLEAVTNAEGETTRYVYDPVGNQTDLIEPDGVVTHYEYDGVYRLAAVILNHRPGLPADHQTNVAYRYEYDPNGNLVRVHLLPNGASATRFLTYTYDALNRLIAESDPLGNTWRYGYDPAGNRIREVDASGHLTVYTYNADDLPVRIAYDNGTTVAFAYDENHNRTVMTDTLGVSRWVYDPLNRIVAVTDSLGRALGYAYDAVGNRIAITYPVTGTVTYAYDANHRLRGVTDPYGHTTRYERDGVGNLVRQLNPNGTVTEAAYDRANRLVGLTTRRLDGTVIAAFAYEVNEVGLRTGMTATYGWRNPPVVVERYTYDPLRRLTGVTDSEGFRETYGYDAAGNRTRWWANDDRTTPRPGDGFEVTYTYDAADRLR